MKSKVHKNIQMRHERLGDLKARHHWTSAMNRYHCVEGLSDDDLVISYTEVNEFGRFLRYIEIVDTPV